MKIMTLKHSEAVSAAKGQMIRIIERDTSPRFKDYIENQVHLLGEVYWWILDSIYTPGLPFEDKPTHGTFELSDKPKDGEITAKEE